MMKKILSVSVLMILFAAVSLSAKTHVIRDGDTLWELAAQHYGDPTLYPILLEVNGIDNPRTIPNGRVIIIPDRSAMRNIAQERDPERRRQLIARAGTGASGNNDSNSRPQVPVNTGADSVSRTGDAVDPEETGFSKILAGPKVSGDKLIKTNTP